MGDANIFLCYDILLPELQREVLVRCCRSAQICFSLTSPADDDRRLEFSDVFRDNMRR